jgi:hypothetical protein
MLECWSGLAELLWHLRGEAPDLRPETATLRQVYRHLTRYTARNPGAAARLGWAASLLLEAAGANRTAARTARRALEAARRMAVPYDREKAEEALCRIGRTQATA